MQIHGKINEIYPKRIQSVSKIVRIQNVSITYPKRIQNTRIHNVSKFGPPYPKRIHNVSKTYPKRIQRMSVSKKVRIQKKSVSPSAAESMFFRLILDTNLLMPLCGGMSIILDTTPCILGTGGRADGRTGGRADGRAGGRVDFER